MKKKSSIDRFALKRDKEMTPGARLDWLAAARNLVLGAEKKTKKDNWLPDVAPSRTDDSV